MSSDRLINLAVLVSGSGRTLQNFIELSQRRQLPAQVKLVIASRPALGGIEKAHRAGITNVVVERKQFATIADFSKQVFDLCNQAKADLVCLAGWLCLLEIPGSFDGRVMNIHPALLPAFGGKGMYGHHVHQSVIDYGCKVSGCTAHFVDADYDKGPVILQRVCEVQDDDTADSLAARVFEEELIAYPEAIRLFKERRLQIAGRRVRITNTHRD